MSLFSFGGVSTALITPFKNGKIDFISLKKLIRFQLDEGIQGLVVGGSTAEAATLNFDEKTKLLDFVLNEVASQVPVVMGSGTFNTAESCDLAKAFAEQKPQGLLVVTPYYNKPPQRGMIAHYLKIAESSELPIIIYNVPGRTSISLDVETVAQLAKISSRIVGIKEAAGKVEIIKSLKEKCPKDFLVLSGDDETYLAAMGQGAHGVISVISHVVPKWCVAAAAQAQNGENIEKLTGEIKEVATVLFCESNPIPVKWALKQMGIIDSGEVRLPLVDLDEKFHGPVKSALTKMGAL